MGIGIEVLMEETESFINFQFI